MSCPVISIDSSDGYLDLIIGPMYSGKTDYLIRELNIFATMGARVLYVNHVFDTRGDVFSSHNPMLTKIGNISHIKVETVEQLLEACNDYLIIGVDESQFFKGLKEAVIGLVEKQGKRVLVAGLSGNYKREAFGELLDLIPYCDRVTKLASCCSACAVSKKIKQAHFSYRVTSDEIEVFIGSKNEYVPLCRECFIAKCI
uniref:thymidine kinase n=1 Tax=viral metagenome TaxID=1070528 RepID=A0A6C0KEW7_9ZZZZ